MCFLIEDQIMCQNFNELSICHKCQENKADKHDTVYKNGEVEV